MAVVLVVDDEMIIALGTSMVLEDAGYAVLLASDGEKGLEKALASAPDLIITDYMMPRMDGIEMIRALRQAGNQTPIVIATAIPEERLPSNPHPLHDAYLSKPFSDHALLKAVRQYLGDG